MVSSLVLQAQTLWSDNFDGVNPYLNWDTNTTDLSAIVGGNVENHWVINNVFNGITTPFPVNATPAQPGTMANPNLNYMHISSRDLEAVGANNANYTYNTSVVGERYFSRMNTDVNTTGQTNVFIDFWYLNLADGAAGTSGRLYYSTNGGTSWNQVGPAYTNTNTWTQTSVSDPAFDNQPTLRFGFLFENPAAGNNPAFSVDEIVIGSPPPLTAIISQPSPIPTSICLGDTVTLTADDLGGQVTQYQWNFAGANNGPQTVTTQSVLFEAGSVGAFNFQLIVGDGTSLDTLTFPMTVNPCTPPTIQFSGSPTTVCIGSTVTFTESSTAGSQPITNWDWNFDVPGFGQGGQPATFNGQNPNAITYNNLGTFDVVLTLTDANGTYSDTLVDYIEVVNCPVPIAAFQAGATQICPGDCINLLDQSLNMNAGNAQWFWSFPGADSVASTQQNPSNICYQTPGTYDITLIAQNDNGRDTLTLTDYIQVDSCLSPEARFVAEKDSICQGTCIQFFNNSIRGTQYEWRFFGADTAYDESTEKNPVVCYSDTGEFDVQLQVTNQYGVDIEYLNDYISVAAYPEVQADVDQNIFVGETADLTAFGSAPYFQWSPDYELECMFCREAKVSPRLNTVYYVTNVNDHGCASTDSVRVNVSQAYFVGVPDIFSPNGDGENDVLYVRGNGIQFIEYYVYDRYGAQIFESRSQERGWDGTYQGEQVPPGVYVYFAKITFLNGKQELIKGDVTVIR